MTGTHRDFRGLRSISMIIALTYHKRIFCKQLGNNFEVDLFYFVPWQVMIYFNAFAIYRLNCKFEDDTRLLIGLYLLKCLFASCFL